MIRAVAFSVGLAALAAGAEAQSLAQNNDVMFRQIQQVHRVSAAQLNRIKEIFARSGIMGQGNPGPTRHPMTPEQCAARVGGTAAYNNPRFEAICGAKYMAPLYDPRTETPEDATACIDQFEFPNIPCTYPVTWVRANEAAQICAAMGKRICDAHEWEGACAGALTEPDYPFGAGSVAAMRSIHNNRYAGSKRWAYGPNFRTGICAQDSNKSPGCNGGDFGRCGTNTYPTGAFPNCTSGLRVYDLHGNAAEHMNLPMSPGEMASRGSTGLGVTEMKGSWFIWDKYRAHEDWCRWRAPYWHGSRVMAGNSHRNYHLGFRCCKTVN
ncbi:SUMF1/EgtB/PvdO family nonheme iron enzyme [Psychromarinibacter sp. C21-152]|uniref:SUMF1/EgtB/PvdO family nonheme iron enzyme n=1 Tax=Psychromarinibacter sediminicola TaxID=3033385 RepID=A0AAE3NS10_9RHOB|nr:SUMF1/EgtB/PvdO family nonheme iron enzyme [Psychromarinibacter sediminicola]MDF0602458.1 SUMF1/EgtB/PvdO family nonheme iron enzyme [Psychromarinibacter sediminicola]